MRRFPTVIICILFPVLLAAAWTDLGAEFEFYRESPAAAGVGSCGVAWGMDPAAWGYNPATGLDAGSGVLLKHTSAFTGNGRIANDLLALSYKTSFGGIGGLLYRNGAGNIYLTSLPDTTRPVGPDNRPVVDDTVTAADWVGQVSGVYTGTDGHLSLGANLKVFYRNLVAASGFGLGADLGIRYRFDWGLALGARFQNASSSPVFWSTDSTDYLTPRAGLGGMQEFAFNGSKLRLYLESEVSLEGLDSLETHLGPIYLRPRGGVEFVIADVLSLRAGRGDYGWTVGAGGAFKGFFADYAYRTHDGGLGGTHLVAAGYRF
ncbi:hypothetical protein JXM67_06875 [candidate division WOR-3 bacterium]|nr:hypothetical protein [candidate division WOR-3 bacterium]